MQESGLHLSDISPMDMARDYVLMAERRKVEAGLKRKMEVRICMRHISLLVVSWLFTWLGRWWPAVSTRKWCVR